MTLVDVRELNQRGLSDIYVRLRAYFDEPATVIEPAATITLR